MKRFHSLGWLAGTAVSKLAVVVLSLGQIQAATIDFTTRAGMTCVAEASADLQAWTAVGSAITGDGNPAHITVSSDFSRSFFRVRIESPFTFDHLQLRTHVDLDDLKSGFSASVWRATAKEVVRRSVPDAGWIVDADSDPNFFYVWFGGEMTDFTQMVFRLSAAVHETIHHVGFEHMTFNGSGFDMALALGKESFFSAPSMGLFPRSEILNSLPPDMQSLGYASTYLTGGSGGQDLVSLLDEFNAYTFTTLVDTAILPYMTGLASCSSRDGVLAMMLFTEEYLRVAREQHPGDYIKIMTSPLRDLIVILWDRAERTLKMAEGDPRLGHQDQAIRAHVYAPERLLEIRRVQEAVLPRISINR